MRERFPAQPDRAVGGAAKGCGFKELGRLCDIDEAGERTREGGVGVGRWESSLATSDWRGACWGLAGEEIHFAAASFLNVWI